MLKVKSRKERHLFDPWQFLSPKRRENLDDNWPGFFREHVLDLLPVEKLGLLFPQDRGRPTKDQLFSSWAMVIDGNARGAKSFFENYVFPEPIAVSLYSFEAYGMSNPITNTDPFGLEVFEINDLYETGFCNRSPDYYALIVSYGFGLMAFELDAYKNLYFTPLGGGTVGRFPSKWIGLPGLCMMSGWIDECSDNRPSEDELNELSNGLSRTISTGYVFGEGYTWSGGKRAFKFGLTTLQFGSFNTLVSVKTGSRHNYKHMDYLMP